MTVVLLHVEELIADNVTFQLWIKAFHTSRFLLVGDPIQFFFKVMAVLWLADGMMMDNATFHL